MDVPLTILFMMACVSMTHIKGSNSLHLTSFPATASPDQPYTLMCGSIGTAKRLRAWYWRKDIIFRTRYISNTNCHLDIINSDKYQHLLGRINVACSYDQYNVTLRILTSTDNGSVWWCVMETESQESNRLTIHVVKAMKISSTTTTAAATATAATTITTTATTSTTSTRATTNMPVSSTANATTTAAAKSSKSPQVGDTDADNQVVYIAAGVGGGVAVVIVAVLSALCIRRRRGRHVNNGSVREQKQEASHTYYNENSDLQDQDINDKVQVENDIYETSHDVTSPNQPSTNDNVITDVYAQVQKPKKNKPKPTGTADDINIEDLYAKPDKTKIRKKQED